MVTKTAEELENLLKEPEQTKPKRGRPKGSKNGQSSRAPRRPSANMRGQIGNVLRAANFAFVQMANQYALYAIREDEIDPLAAALEIEINSSARMQKLLGSAGKISPHIALISILGQMAMTRYALYSATKTMMGAGAYGGLNGFRPDGNSATVPLETGGTSGDNRGYGDGQDVPGVFTPTDAEASYRPEI